MKILGLSSNFHDSSAAVVADGRILSAAAEERYSYQKHDPSFPALSLDACLHEAGLTSEEIDIVAYHEDPVVKFSRILASRVSRFPSGFTPFANSMREFMLGQIWIKFDIFNKTGLSPKKVHFVPHHLGHATYAFAASGLEEAAVLVVDAVGEWSSTTFFKGSRKNGRLEMTPLGVVPYPHSLGMVYSAFTGFFGFKVNDGECSTMALASFGQPKYVEKIRKIIRPHSDGTYEVDLDFFDFSDPERLPLSKKFFDLFGERRFFRDSLPFASTMNPKSVREVPERFLFYADLAASLQKVLEETVLSLCAKLARETGLEHLCFAGGGALNSVLNGRMLRESPFKSVFIPPDPGDGGGALGAALYIDSQVGGSNSKALEFTPYFGSAYDESDAVGLVESLELDEMSRHRTLPSELSALQRITVERFSSDRFDDLTAGVVDDLKAGKIVGWLQGRFENGPRALGNRSLLIDPRNAAAARRLSRNVKLRAAFRPYACSVLGEKAESFFDASSAQIQRGMRWMSSTFPVRAEAQAGISQALHVDQTTRPQIVFQKDNPRYHRLIEHWSSVTGVPAILNTSFNESGLPLVSSPVDALLMFVRTDIETLVLNNAVLRKRF
jgi:carbamoyltransferase